MSVKLPGLITEFMHPAILDLPYAGTRKRQQVAVKFADGITRNCCGAVPALPSHSVQPAHRTAGQVLLRWAPAVGRNSVFGLSQWGIKKGPFLPASCRRE